MGSPYAAHMQPICGPYVECFQKQPNCMRPICCLTYGNIWRKTNQHMGRASTYGKHIWADVVILALKVSTSQHMGSIWETYGEHTLYGQYPEQHKQTSPFPCCCSTLKLSQASTKFVLKVFLLTKNSRLNYGDDEILTCKRASAFAFTIHLTLETRSSCFLLQVLCNNKTKTMYE